MKRISIILALTGIYLILCSKSCNDQYEQSRGDAQRAIKAAKDSLLSAVPRIASPNLAILSEEARLLCSDIADYLKIVADSSLPEAFREQARKMVLEGFISEMATIRLSTLNGKSHRQDDQPGGHTNAAGKNRDHARITFREFSVIKLLDKADSGFRELRITRPDSIWIAEPLKPISDKLFKGLLGYSSHPEDKPTSYDHHFTFPGDGIMDFYAVQSNKIFGHDTLAVWSVKLGENRCK